MGNIHLTRSTRIFAQTLCGVKFYRGSSLFIEAVACDSCERIYTAERENYRMSNLLEQQDRFRICSGLKGLSYQADEAARNIKLLQDNTFDFDVWDSVERVFEGRQGAARGCRLGQLVAA